MNWSIFSEETNEENSNLLLQLFMHLGTSILVIFRLEVQHLKISLCCTHYYMGFMFRTIIITQEHNALLIFLFLLLSLLLFSIL